jgi:ATP-dependent DNA helicase RecG
MEKMKLTSSPRLAEALATMGIHDFKDVLMHFPYRYEDLTPTNEVLLIDKQRLVLTGKVKSAPQLLYFSTIKAVQFYFTTNQGLSLQVIAFNRTYLAKSIKVGETYTIVGTYDATRRSISLTTIIEDINNEKSILRPIYSLIDGLSQSIFRRLVLKAIINAKSEDYPIRLPKEVISELKINSKLEVIKNIHFPKTIDQVQQASKLFKYEEAFAFAKKMIEIKEANQEELKTNLKQISEKKILNFISGLPYSLTSDQEKAVSEILSNMNSRKRMYRLLQGDVGSGKTLVASIALYGNFLRGFQGALMAPTDQLAKQHYQTLSKFFHLRGLKVSLLVGSLPSSVKNEIKEQLINGTIDVIVGTHALFSQDVDYQSLGLVIIDEQHRFGVNQRDALQQKGMYADLLMMSATPIPRSLAMTVFADMDVTSLNQFPFSERKVKTIILQENDALIDYQIQIALEQQKRVYVIAPKIEDRVGEKQSVLYLFKLYQKKYPNKVVALHGQMDSEDKDDALSSFASGRKPIIVSTTVIEVGIDVKSATVMIIHDAHLFGLASLHQLRGRIGRDGHDAICMLVINNFGIEGKERLDILVESNDGFYIAEKDLELRGPGELTGIKQSGLPAFTHLNVLTDHKIMVSMREICLKHRNI